jgi:hypothetical protein
LGCQGRYVRGIEIHKPGPHILFVFSPGGGLVRASGAFGRFDGVSAEAEKLEGFCKLAVGIGDAPFELEYQNLIPGKIFMPSGQGAVVHASLESIGHRGAVTPKTRALLVRQS